MKKWCLLVILIVGFLGVCMSAPRVSASQFNSKEECLNASGGRRDISSVDWACDWVGTATETVCALWIGSATNTVDPIIYTDKTSGKVTIRYYRMCYDGTLGTAHIWVENDNGAIDDSMNMNGGTWNNPKHIDTQLDVGKFISGISSTEVTHDGKVYNEYSRWVKVGRQSETASSCDAYSGACSEMNELVRVRILKKSFQAKADVSDSSTGYVVNGSTSKTVTCNNAMDGCSVGFSFYIKKISGSSSDDTTYGTEKIGPSGSWTGVESNKSSTASSGGTEVATYSATIKAGQRICYRMNYHPHGSYGENTTKTVTACAYAVGEFSSSIDIKAKKQSSRNYSDNMIYARPDDKIDLQGTYAPRAQYAASLRPKIVEVNGTTNSSSGTVQSRFNSIVGSNGWKNTFSIRLDRGSTGLLVQHKGGTIGAIDTYKFIAGYSINAKQDPGNALKAKALTNNDDSHKTAPKKSTISYDKTTGFKVTVDPNRISDELQIVVPYNFINSTKVTLDDNVSLYAGEAMSISYDIETRTRKNNKIGSTYATIVRGAQWELQMSADGGKTWEKYGKKTNQVLNKNGKIDGDSISLKSTAIVPDVKAGTMVCFRSAVYPASSGGDTNIDKGGDKEWAYSDSKCYTVAKRPSLQVWGGNIYSNGAITTSVAVKKRLAGESDGTHVFGSWGELGIIANGQVKGLASGAGYAYNTGANNTGFCFVSTLSFANDKCNSETTGSLGVSFGVLDDEKKLIIEKLTNAEDVTKYSSTDELEERIGGDSGIILVENDETVNITKPIIYDDTYTSFESMPKVVIYAKNVNINCNVTQIDALIIAEDAVNTCSNISDVNDQGRSVQLKVNGAIVADKLIAGRTYGAGTGTNSGIPAEIINFDPSLYLWGNDAIKTDPNSSLVNVYLRELSPRY